MSFISCFLTCLLVTVLTFGLAAQALSPEQQKAVDKIFHEWDNDHSPGCALAIVQDGKIAYSKGYGMADLEHRIPNTPQSVFYIASVSKQFVNMCMLLLVEDGMLSLDDDVHKYIPELPDYQHPITIRNLIHHTSGIRDFLQLWEMSGRSYLDKVPEEEALALICRQRDLNFEPGTRYLYSNSCYFMMGLILQRITGKTLREFGEERIFGPLGMASSQFYNDNRILIPDRAFGYGAVNHTGNFSNMMLRYDLVGSGGIYSNVEDLFKWDQNYYENKIGRQGQKLIDQMLTNGRYQDGTEVDYAFGLEKRVYKGLSAFGHGGALGGYRSAFWQFPEQRTSIIILSNFENLDPGGRVFEIADIILKDNFREVSEEAQAFPKPVKLSGKKLNAFTGSYWNHWDMNQRQITLEDGKLFYVRGADSRSELIPFADNKFYMAGLPYMVEVRFEQNTMTVLIPDSRPVILTAFEPFSPSGEQIDEYTGTFYSSDLNATYSLSVSDGQLQLTLPNASVKLTPVSKNLFFRDNVGTIRFIRDKMGNVIQLRLDAGRVRNVLFEKQ